MSAGEVEARSMRKPQPRTLKALARRADKARKFMVNTCPASRHAHSMADALAAGQTYHMFQEEPEHCASTLYSVLISLWEARDELSRLTGNWWAGDGAGRAPFAVRSEATITDGDAVPPEQSEGEGMKT